MRLSLIFLLLCVLVTVEGRCPRGWLRFERHCYKSFPYRFNFFHALRFCAQKKAFLLNIGSHEEYEFVLPILRIKNGFNPWLGMTNFENKNSWHGTVDNSPYIHTWLPGYPTNNKMDNCVAICAITKSGDFGKIYNNVCTNKRPFICEKDEF